MPNIMTITMNPCIDKSTSVDNVVAERKLRCSRPRYEPGGGGINVSRAMHRLGEDSKALYLAGGSVGDMLKQLLDKEHIRHEPFEIGAMVRESLVVYEESSEQQYRFGMPGPEIQEREWQKFMERLDEIAPKPDFIIGSGSLPPGVPEDFYARVSKWGKHHGTKTIVDTPGGPLSLACKEGVFLVKPNLRELEILAGKRIENEEEQENHARRLVDECGTEVVVVSLGAAGALFAWKEGVDRVRAPTVPIKSKVGAGDSMVAGIMTALKRGWEIPDAVRFGVAAGAAAVMTEGTELCRREDTERLYERIKNQ
jgi:6-phosphofructokinase 2